MEKGPVSWPKDAELCAGDFPLIRHRDKFFFVYLSSEGLRPIFPKFHTALRHVTKSQWLSRADVSSPMATTAATMADKLNACCCRTHKV